MQDDWMQSLMSCARQQFDLAFPPRQPVEHSKTPSCRLQSDRCGSVKAQSPKCAEPPWLGFQLLCSTRVTTCSPIAVSAMQGCCDSTSPSHNARTEISSRPAMVE